MTSASTPTTATNNDLDPFSEDAPLASLFGVPLHEMSTEELRAFISQTQELKSNPVKLKSRKQDDEDLIKTGKPKSERKPRRVDVSDLI